MSLTKEERTAIVNYRLEKAFSTYVEAEKVLGLDIYNLTANRLYYAVYYAATALLLQNGYSSHTHRGAMTLFHLHKSNIHRSDKQKKHLLVKKLFLWFIALCHH